MPKVARWARSGGADVTGASAPKDCSLQGCEAVATTGGDALVSELRLNTAGPLPPGRELLPGFVHYPGVLSPGTQQALLDVACAVTSRARDEGASGGWHRKESDGKWSLNDGTKARFWDRIDDVFPAGFRELGQDLARLSARDFPKALASSVANFEPQVGALNYYTGRGRMGWHADDYNFAKKDRPLVMANLGDAADFGYRTPVAAAAKGADRSVRLESGDVIVFGGEARDLVHALLRVYEGTAPANLRTLAGAPGGGPGPLVGRVSVTWRDCGPEDGLTFNSDERLGLTVTENTLPRYVPKRRGGGGGGGGGGAMSVACRGCGGAAQPSGRSGPVYCQACWDAWQK